MDASYVLIGVVLLFAMLVLVRRLAGGSGSSGDEIDPYVAKPLLTEHEFTFFEKLSQASERVGAEAVFPQVAMAAMVDVRRDMDPAARRSARNRFDRKVVDFVLVDAKMSIMMIVELDDRTHDGERARAADAARDSITASAGYATARFRYGRKTTVTEIEKELRRAMTSAR